MMQPVTVYLPIDLDSGPHCPPDCVGNWKHHSTCAVFWADLTRAVDKRGKPLRNHTGFTYNKCEDCIRAVRQANIETASPVKKTTIRKWRPSPDILCGQQLD